jgi:hypothetical protein
MNIRFEERPYSGKTFRPRPEIHVDPASGLLLVVTPWGPREAARKIIDRMAEFLATTRKDREATSPFPRLSCLSDDANALRTAILLANETLFRDDNRSEFSAGVEVFAGILNDEEFVWAQAGNPQILLSREGRSLLPLGSQVDLSFDFSEGNELLPALPSQLLGLDSSLNMTINSFRVQPGDRVVLLSHSHLPENIFSANRDDLTIDRLSQTLAKTRPDHAFWLGILHLVSAAAERAA